LITVVRRLSWRRVAHISRRAERTVRTWSEPDVGSAVPLPVALALDIAFIEAGNHGEVAPFEAWYLARLRIARSAAQVRADAPVDLVAIAAREGGEAIAAQVVALRPGATARDRRIAQEETEQAIVALAATLSTSIGLQP
jgi:hypothetical protein